MTGARPRARLTLRARLALLVAAAVALAVAACAVASWYLTRDRLYQELDRRLGSTAAPPMPPQPNAGRPPRNERFRGDPDGALAKCRPDATTTASGFRPPGPEIIQMVTVSGDACTLPNAGALTVTDADRQVAMGERESATHDGTGVVPSGGRTEVRVLTRRFFTAGGTPAAVSYAIPLDEVRGPLDGLALLLTAVSALGVLVSAGAGLAIARASLRPVDRLTDLVEHIARTEDLDTRIPDEGADEIARLSRSFNSMTTALAASRDRQQQLIADAGHELRTPLTSLRTNIDLLLRTALAARFTDAQCGFKAARTGIVQALLPSVEDEEWFFDTELLLLAERNGLRIHEVPAVSAVPDRAGRGRVPPAAGRRAPWPRPAADSPGSAPTAPAAPGRQESRADAGPVVVDQVVVGRVVVGRVVCSMSPLPDPPSSRRSSPVRIRTRGSRPPSAPTTPSGISSPPASR